MPSPFPRFDEWNSIQCAVPGGPRDKCASATVGGQHFLIGGQNGDNEPLDTVFAYDSTSNVWTEHTPLPEPRFRCSATAIDNHRLMLIGGYSETTNRSTLVYDTTTRLWASLPDLNVGRWKAAIVSTNNRVYVIGGRSVNGRERSIEELDLSRNPRRWSVLPQELATKREGCRAVVHPRNNDSIIVVGGFNGRDRYLTTCEIVNVGQGHGEATGTLPPMTSPRKDHGLVLLDNRFLIAIGGSNGSPLPSVEMLQLDHTNHGHRNGWCRLPQMQTAREDGAAFLSGHDQILVVAGHISDNGMEPTMEQLLWLHDNDEYEQQEQWQQQRERAAPADEHEQQPQWQQQRGRAAPAAAYDQQPQWQQQRGRAAPAAEYEQQPQWHQQRGRAAPAEYNEMENTMEQLLCKLQDNEYTLLACAAAQFINAIDTLVMVKEKGVVSMQQQQLGRHALEVLPPPPLLDLPGGRMDQTHKTKIQDWIEDTKNQWERYRVNVEEAITNIRDEQETQKATRRQQVEEMQKLIEKIQATCNTKIAEMTKEEHEDEEACLQEVESAELKLRERKAQVEDGLKMAGQVLGLIDSRVQTPIPPNELLCPITHELMVDPVMTADGHTYERSAIERHFARTPPNENPRSPVTGVVLASRTLIHNVAIRSLCRDFGDSTTG